MLRGTAQIKNIALIMFNVHTQNILTNFLSVCNWQHLVRIRTNKNADETAHVYFHGEAKADKKTDDTTV